MAAQMLLSGIFHLSRRLPDENQYVPSTLSQKNRAGVEGSNAISLKLPSGLIIKLIVHCLVMLGLDTLQGNQPS